MKHVFSSLIIGLAAGLSWAQSVQNGLVMEYNGSQKKTALANVEIAVRNAQRTVSDRNGRFRLDFRTLKPGDKIEVREIQKNGYVIFNQEALDEWRVAKGNEPFTIVLCKNNHFMDLKERYYAIASKSYAQRRVVEEKALADKMLNGELQRLQYEQQLRDLKNQYADQLENLETYIEHFARIDLSELDDHERKIIQRVQEGDIDGAIQAYDEMQIMQKMDLANAKSDRYSKLQRKAEAEKMRLYALAKNQMSLLRLRGGRESFERIEQMLTDMASKLSDRPEVVMDCVDFFTDQSNTERAIYWSRIYLRFPDIDPVQRGFVESCLASSLYNLGQWEEALTHNQAALDCLAPMLTGSDSRAIYRYMNALILQGGILGMRGRTADAIQCLQRSVTMCDSLLANDRLDQTSQKYKAEAQLRWTMSLARANRWAEAHKLCLQLIDFIRPKAESDDPLDYWLIRYGRALNEMAFISGRMGNTASNGDYLSQSVAIWKQLYELNPQAYVSDYANACQHLLFFYYNNHDMEKCLAAAVKELELREEACRIPSDLEMASFALASSNLGYLYTHYGDSTLAETHILKAIEVQTALAEKSPKTYGGMLVHYKADLFQLYLERKDDGQCAAMEKALRDETEALFNRRTPEDTKAIGYAWSSLGTWALRQGDRPTAEALRDRIAALNPDYMDDEDCARFVNELKE